MKYVRLSVFYVFILFLSFSFLSCDFIKHIFVPPINLPEVTNITIPLVDQDQRRSATDVKVGSVLTLRVNTDIQYTIDDIKWSSEGPVTLYTGLRDAIVNVSGAGNGKITCSIKTSDKTAYGEYIFSSVNGSSDSIVTVSAGTITSITPELSSVTLDIGQINNIKINNNININNVKYIAISNNDNVSVLSGIDYVAIKGLKTGTSVVSVYNESKSVYCSINVTVSSNIYTPASTTISANYDVIKLSTGQQTIVSTNIKTSAFSEDDRIFSILYSDGYKHVVECNSVGISSLILINTNNNSDILSIPVIVSNNGTIYVSSNNDFSVPNTYYDISINQKVFIPINNVYTTDGLIFNYEDYYINLYKNSNGIIIEGKNVGNTTLTISNNSMSITINIFIKDSIYTEVTKPADKYFNASDSYNINVNSLCYINYSTNDNISMFITDNIASIYTYTNNIIVIKTNGAGVTHLKVYNKNMDYLLKDILLIISDTGTNVVSDVISTQFENLTISPVNSTVRKGETLYFNVANNVSSSYVWGISNTDIADIVISNNTFAKVIGKNVGDTYITCSTSDGKYTTSTILTVVPVNTEYTTNDYIGLSGETSIVMYVGDTYTYTISTIPSQINGQIEMKYIVDDPNTLSVTNYNNMSCNLKALKPGITTLYVGDINNKYKKYVNVLVKDVGDVESPSFITLVKDYYVMDIGDTEKISVSIVPTPKGVYKPENESIFSYSDPSAFNIFGNYSTTTFTALKSGEYTITVRNKYANNSPYTVKVFVKSDNTYLTFNRNTIFGVTNKVDNITCYISNVPSNYQPVPSDFKWDIVDKNNNVVTNPSATIINYNKNNVSLKYNYACSEHYLRFTFENSFAKVLLSISDDNILNITNTPLSFEPCSTAYIKINDILPTNVTPLIYVSDSAGAVGTEFDYDSNHVVQGIRVYAINKKESADNATLTIMHPINKKISYTVPVNIKWQKYFRLYDNSTLFYVSSNSYYNSSWWRSDGTYSPEAGALNVDKDFPLFIKYSLSPPYENNITFSGNALDFYNVYLYGYNSDTREGTIVITPKLYTSDTKSLNINSAKSGSIGITLKQTLNTPVYWETFVQYSNRSDVTNNLNSGDIATDVFNFGKSWSNGRRANRNNDIKFTILYKPYTIINGVKSFINLSNINCTVTVNGPIFSHSNKNSTEMRDFSASASNDSITFKCNYFCHTFYDKNYSCFADRSYWGFQYERNILLRYYINNVEYKKYISVYFYLYSDSNHADEKEWEEDAPY